MLRSCWIWMVPGAVVGALLLSGCGPSGQGSDGGDDAFAGIEFTSASSELTSDCRAAADQLGFPVPCPTEHPTTGENLRCAVPPDLRDAQVSPKEGCVIGSAFVLAINGIPAGRAAESISHFVIEATPLNGASRTPNCEGSSAQFGEHEGRVGTCDGIHINHVAAFWDRDEVLYVVSAHGNSDVRRRVVQRVAEAVELMPPGH